MRIDLATCFASNVAQSSTVPIEVKLSIANAVASFAQAQALGKLTETAQRRLSALIERHALRAYWPASLASQKAPEPTASPESTYTVHSTLPSWQTLASMAPNANVCLHLLSSSLNKSGDLVVKHHKSVIIGPHGFDHCVSITASGVIMAIKSGAFSASDLPLVWIHSVRDNDYKLIRKLEIRHELRSNSVSTIAVTDKGDFNLDNLLSGSIIRQSRGRN